MQISMCTYCIYIVRSRYVYSECVEVAVVTTEDKTWRAASLTNARAQRERARESETESLNDAYDHASDERTAVWVAPGEVLSPYDIHAI